MLKSDRQTDYAVRVLLALAKSGEGARLSNTNIQEAMLILPMLIARIVAQLAHAGLVNTFAGREGGCMLCRPVSQITLKDGVEAFEGLILLSEWMQAKSESDRPLRSDCPVRSKWGRVQVVMLREMDSSHSKNLRKKRLVFPWPCQVLLS